ncbi:MAG: GAF domain-containing protein [Verrucomicrobiota bacterium]|jgi:GAF domain-containing protein
MLDDLEHQITALLKDSPPTNGLEQTLRAVLEFFQAQTGTIHVLDGGRQTLQLAAQVGLPPELLRVVRVIPVGKGIAGQAVARGQPVTLCNLQTDASGVAPPAARQTGVGGALCVPLRRGDAIVGAIGVGTTRSHEYTAEEVHALEQIGRVIGAQCRWDSPR